MGGVGEHVDRLHGDHLVGGVEVGQVAGLRGGVATDIDDAARACAEDGLHHVGVHAGTWRVGDEHVGSAVQGDELIGEDVFHVSGKEQGVVDAVDAGVFLGIVDGFGHILDADDLPGLSCHEIGDGAGAGVEVINQFAAGEGRQFACHGV